MAQAECVTEAFSHKYGEISVIFGHIELKEGFIQLVQPFSITPNTEITENSAFETQHKPK